MPSDLNSWNACDATEATVFERQHEYHKTLSTYKKAFLWFPISVTQGQVTFETLLLKGNGRNTEFLLYELDPVILPWLDLYI